MKLNRGVMFEYVDAVRKLAVWLFQLLSESLVLGYDLPVIRPNGLMGLVLAP
jgi:hypothetical protein